MTLLLDIGNSTVVIASANDKGAIGKTWRFKTRKDGDTDFYINTLSEGFAANDTQLTDVEDIIVSSVVPEINDVVSEALTRLTGLTPHFFCLDDAKKIISFDVEAPEKVGKDRIADAIGAVAVYGAPAIVFDLGTATTVGIVDDSGCFRGGMIIPGVKTALTALSSRASQLPVVDVIPTETIIGRNTLECMQSGILYGAVATIDGLIDRLSSSFSKPFNIVATGGMSKHIAPFCIHEIIVDEFLQIKGLFAVRKK